MEEELPQLKFHLTTTYLACRVFKLCYCDLPTFSFKSNILSVSTFIFLVVNFHCFLKNLLFIYLFLNLSAIATPLCESYCLNSHSHWNLFENSVHSCDNKSLNSFPIFVYFNIYLIFFYFYTHNNLKLFENYLSEC